MTKEQFNQLEVLDQIKYINNQLENNSTLTLVCKELSVGRSTIRDRFKKINYIYSRGLNRYIYNDSITDVSQNITTENNKCIADVSQTNKVTDIINKSDVEIKETLLDIVNNYDTLKEIIELHRRNTSVIKQQIVIDVEDAESKLTTLRVNEKILSQFNEFCNNHKQYKKVDLLSQAIKEFITKYK